MLGLLVASITGAFVKAVGVTIVFKLFSFPPAAPALILWGSWFASDVTGIAAVAAPVIALAAAFRRPPPRSVVIEAAAALGVLAVINAFIISLPPEPWETVLASALLVPVMIWLCACCRPVFAAVGALMVSTTIIWTTIQGIGPFGETLAPIDDRIIRSQVVIMVISFGTFILAALFEERRENELCLARANAMLERERDNKLTNVQAALASVAHEVRQPLTGIALSASAARRFLQMTPPHLDEVGAALGRIYDASHHISELLEGIRALFKKGDQRRQTVNINETIRSVLQLLDERLKDHEVVADLASELPLVQGHKGQLQEVFSNLFLNAIEAMDTTVDRMRVLGVKTELRDRNTIGVAVQDTGPGINQENIAQIFNAFVTTKQSGMGLGLAITQRIIESHGGQFTASSDGKSGALFQVVLPVGSSVDTDTTEAA